MLKEEARSDADYVRLMTAQACGAIGASKLQVTRWRALLRNNRLYVPASAALQTRILHGVPRRPAGRSPRKDKTIEQVKRRFYWPRHGRGRRAYVTSCDACQRNKPSQQATMGLLQPLPIPTRPWQQVSMDLITQLPRSRSGNDAIVVFVDKLTKMVHYVATTTNVTRTAAGRHLHARGGATARRA